MKAFQHFNAPDIQIAVSLLKTPNTAAIAGGTDLITELKRRIRHPEKVVNLKTIPDLRYISQEDAMLRIGALATIADIEGNAVIRERFPALSQAASAVGSPQIRNAGTMGGNLCQSVRCWYYRHPDVQCWLKDGDTCYARQGVNRYHAVFGKCPCVAVNPSDSAPVLVALDATVQIAGTDKIKEVPVESLFRLPDEGHRRQTVIQPGNIIREIAIPQRPDGSSGVFLKTMERAAWSFALVSVAVQIDWDGDRVRKARVVLGGVAGMPWRVREAEQALAGNTMDDSIIRATGETAVSETIPLEWNAYKVSMVKNLLKKALHELDDLKKNK